MSRIGKLPIHLEQSVKASVAGGMLKVEGPKGKLEIKLHPGYTVDIKDSEIVVKRPGRLISSRGWPRTGLSPTSRLWTARSPRIAWEASSERP